jgi:O-antigen/teichoic acid export membrane protein
LIKLLYKQLLEAKEKKFVQDTSWLIMSNIILGTAGILINVLLTQHFGVDGFGAFSLGLKVYLIVSLVAVMGCGASLVKYTAQYKNAANELNQSMTAALLLGSLCSLCVVLIVWLGINVLGDAIKSDYTELLLWFLPGIPFFTLNKLVQALLNGKRLIKKMAILQASRWILLIGLVLIHIYVLDSALTAVVLSFGITELLLLPISWLLCRKHFKVQWPVSRNWMKLHWQFGVQSTLSSVVIDIYHYSDVFLIGYFIGTKAVGIYSFAADIAKQTLLLANIIQVNFNPIIAGLWAEENREKMQFYLRKVRKTVHLIYLPVLTLTAIGYTLFINYFMEESLVESLPVFYLLSIGLFIYSGFKPAQSIAELCGYPRDNVLLNIIVLAVSIALNAALIPTLGLVGAAIATAASYCTSVVLLHVYAKKKLSVGLL